MLSTVDFFSKQGQDTYITFDLPRLFIGGYKNRQLSSVMAKEQRPIQWQDNSANCSLVCLYLKTL